MFILANQRDPDVDGSFTRYRQYLRENASRFPASAYALATSDWYFGFASHQAPHDSWLESIQIVEASRGSRSEIREASIHIRTFGAYHDGYIEMYYPKVFQYNISASTLGQGHGDWRYDELRLDEAGHLVHEIEWTSFGATNTWLIVATDVHHKWVPLS